MPQGLPVLYKQCSELLSGTLLNLDATAVAKPKVCTDSKWSEYGPKELVHSHAEFEVEQKVDIGCFSSPTGQAGKIWGKQDF